jgi:hypothetical protein
MNFREIPLGARFQWQNQRWQKTGLSQILSEADRSLSIVASGEDMDITDVQPATGEEGAYWQKREKLFDQLETAKTESEKSALRRILLHPKQPYPKWK